MRGSQTVTNVEREREKLRTSEIVAHSEESTVQECRRSQMPTIGWWCCVHAVPLTLGARTQMDQASLRQYVVKRKRNFSWTVVLRSPRSRVTKSTCVQHKTTLKTTKVHVCKHRTWTVQNFSDSAMTNVARVRKPLYHKHIKFIIVV